MAARLDELEDLAQRLMEIAGILRNLDLGSAEAEEPARELQNQLEGIRARMSELLLLSKAKGPRDALQ
ncbi:MAG: hypothetical protein WBX25_01405 [Rhodomicrobium sp.]